MLRPKKPQARRQQEMTRIRRAAASAGFFVIVLLAIGAAAPYLVDGSTVRGQLFTKISGWADGRLNVRGPVYLTSLFDLTIEAHDVEIRGPARFPEVKTLRAERIAARLSLWDLVNRRIAFEKMWLRGLEVVLKERPDPLTAPQVWRALIMNDPPVLDDVLHKTRDAPIRILVLNDARLAVAGDAKPLAPGIGDFSGVVRRASQARELSLDGTLTWHGQPVTVSLDRTRFSSEGPTETAELSLVADAGPLGRGSVDGRIVRANGISFMGAVDLAGAPAELAAGMLNAPADDVLRRTRIDASGRLIATRRDMVLQELEIGFGDARANGLLRIDLKEKPRISGTLGLGAVDLRGLHIAETALSDVKPMDPPPHGKGHATHYTAWLKRTMERIDFDLRVSAESVILDSVSTGPAAAFLSITDGVAAIDLAELRAFEGVLNGQFEGRWNGNRFRAMGKGRAEGVELGQFLPAPQTYPLATGGADVSFKLSASGDSLSALVRQARLSGHLLGMDGGDLMLNVAALAADGAEARTTGLAMAGESAAVSSRGEYDTMTCRFDFALGKLDVWDLEIVQDAWLIRGKGHMNLAASTLDWQFDAGHFARPTEAASLPFRDSALTSAAEKTIGLHVRGPMSDPRVIYRAPASEPGGVRG